MAITKSTKDVVAVASAGPEARPKIRPSPYKKKAVEKSFTVASHIKKMNHVENALAVQTVGQTSHDPNDETSILRLIDDRSERRLAGSKPTVSDQQIAILDVAGFLKLSVSSGLKRCAAVVISDNMQAYPDYETSIFELDTQFPNLIESIDGLKKVNDVMVANKETRKAAEVNLMDIGTTVDGVSFHTVVDGFEVSFSFDRQLAAMMDRVLNAAFNKEKKVYLVPSDSGVHLGKVVAEMRSEHRSIENDFQNILSLAAETAASIDTLKDGRYRGGVVPQLSAFIEPGRAYRGEIVNSNSRFVAQLTGLGKQDGAPFITVHRLASLDNDKLCKGDKVSIMYDNKFRGASVDVSRNKSPSELVADYEINLGNKIDGVTISDRGGKLGVAFEINQNMVFRIRCVEGALFNKEDKIWEIPKDKLEFALFAAQDLRNEFVLDQKDVAALQLVAKSQINGAKVWPAFTKDGKEYFGPVLAIGDRYALQKSGRENFTLHHLSALDQAPVQGHNLEIHYKLGIGHIYDNDQHRAQDQGR